VFSSCGVLINSKLVGCKELEKLEELYIVDYIFVHMFMFMGMCTCAFIYLCVSLLITVIHCNCNCNLFAFHKSKLGYNPVDIDIVTYILSNILHIVLEES